MAKYKKNKVQNVPTVKLVSVESSSKNTSNQGSKDILQTMEQHRAKFALVFIDEFKQKQTENIRKEFRSYVNNFSAMIRTNGFGQAIAFYTMKGGTHLELVRVIEEWLCINEQGCVFGKGAEQKLLHAITSSDMKTYMAAQNEALALLEWLKKFALAFFESNSNEK